MDHVKARQRYISLPFLKLSQAMLSPSYNTNPRHLVETATPTRVDTRQCLTRSFLNLSLLIISLLQLKSTTKNSVIRFRTNDSFKLFDLFLSYFSSNVVKTCYKKLATICLSEIIPRALVNDLTIL